MDEMREGEEKALLFLTQNETDYGSVLCQEAKGLFLLEIRYYIVTFIHGGVAINEKWDHGLASYLEDNISPRGIGCCINKFIVAAQHKAEVLGGSFYFFAKWTTLSYV